MLVGRFGWVEVIVSLVAVAAPLAACGVGATSGTDAGENDLGGDESAEVDAAGDPVGEEAGPACGDGTCSVRESCSGCAVDCSPCPPPSATCTWHVTTTGSAGGDGSATNPWDLATALANAAGLVQPGDTICLHAGTYVGTFVSELAGSAAAPIVVQSAPGEWAVIDGAPGNPGTDTFVAHGTYAVFRDFEVTNTDPNRCCDDTSFFRSDMVIGHGSHLRFVNLIVHDGGPGFYTWPDAQTFDVEIYGCIVYDVGYDGTAGGRGHGHAMYIKSNDTADPAVTIRDNVVFDEFGYGFHIYTDAGSGYLRHIHLDGNVSFNGGELSSLGASANLGVLGQEPADDIVVANGVFYRAAGAVGRNVLIGPPDTLVNGVVSVRGNWIAGGTSPLAVSYWTAATLDGNAIAGTATVASLDDPATAPYRWDGNTYSSDPGASGWNHAGTSYAFGAWQAATGFDATSTASAGPPGPLVVVRPNAYEPGRANVTLYDPNGPSSVPVDLSSYRNGDGTPLLSAGDSYRIRNVQDLATIAASGTYTGAPVDFPMTAVPPPVPIGMTRSPAPVTGPFFNVFVLQKP